MEYIIHLTNRCNLRCKYCYQNKKDKEIDFENIKSLIDYEISKNSKNAIINFYGGEPLIARKTIYDTIKYIKSKKTKTKFYYSMTTNGTLWDDEFISFVKKNNFISIAYSIDGNRYTQDLNRVTADGKSTFDIVETNARKILSKLKNMQVMAMVVITKNNLKYLGENTEYLFNLGFRKINFLFDYFQNWEEKDLYDIKEKFRDVTRVYEKWLLDEKDVEIVVIDEKIKSHIDGKYDCGANCKMGMYAINVSTNGNFYPCMQLVDIEEFKIGDCKTGIDYDTRARLLKNSKKEIGNCRNCTYRNRCNHTCECKNYILSNDINNVSPLVCETEKIFIETSDEMAERLYNKKSKMFIQKFYNKDYNFFSEFYRKFKR